MTIRRTVLMTAGLCAGLLAAHSLLVPQAPTRENKTWIRQQLVPVDKDVKLEVLDWGGTGRPVVLLTGLGDTAHVYDAFAPKLVGAYHVYGITRRGYGASSKPLPTGDNYSANRLGDDVLKVCDVLHIDRPVLIGHSLAGEELSSIGSRYPNKVAGLVYLEAGYAYAYYDAHATMGDPLVDMAVARRQMEELVSSISIRQKKIVVDELLNTGLPRLEREFRAQQQHLRAMPDTAPAPPDTPEARIGYAIDRGVQEFTGVKCPVLAIFAVPHRDVIDPSASQAAQADALAEDLASTSAQADAFAKGNPSAKVIRIANANHYVYRSNEAEVLHEIRDFIASLSS